MSDSSAVGRGGNVYLSPGSGCPPGAILFMLADNTEFMRIEHNGRCFVRGELVDTNKAVYIHFRRWLRLAEITPPG